MAGKEQEPGWHHSERGTLPLLDLMYTQIGQADSEWPQWVSKWSPCYHPVSTDTHRSPSPWTARAPTLYVSLGLRPSVAPGWTDRQVRMIHGGCQGTSSPETIPSINGMTHHLWERALLPQKRNPAQTEWLCVFPHWVCDQLWQPCGDLATQSGFISDSGWRIILDWTFGSSAVRRRQLWQPEIK